MFVDASAVVAILNEEDLAEDLMARIAEHGGPFYVSPLVRFEASVALARAKADGKRSRTEILNLAISAVDDFIGALDAEEISVTTEIGREARGAGKSFGKFVGHPADLNFGDCFAYACSKAKRAPLLFKGHDFSLTDVNDGFDLPSAGRS
jgi:ribonuclease VapC